MNKKLVFRCWGDEHFNERLNGLITIGPSLPSVHKEKNSNWFTLRLKD